MAHRFFLVLGAMKAGTTSVFRWLSAVPGAALPPVKEPNFFSDDEVWDRGIAWYSKLFDDCPSTAVTGEASTSYSDPAHSRKVASRIAATQPDARLILMVRNPVERLRSHYRHEVQRGRETRRLAAALDDVQAGYVRRSLYYQSLEPYIRLFDREQIKVVRTEDLSMPGFPGWYDILSHLGLPSTPPGRIENATAGKERFTVIGRRLWEAGYLRGLEAHFPRLIKRMGKRLIMGSNEVYTSLLASSHAAIPPHVVAVLEEDTAQLEDWLGVGPMWPRPG